MSGNGGFEHLHESNERKKSGKAIIPRVMDYFNQYVSDQVLFTWAPKSLLSSLQLSLSMNFSEISPELETISTVEVKNEKEKSLKFRVTKKRCFYCLLQIFPKSCKADVSVENIWWPQDMRQSSGNPMGAWFRNTRWTVPGSDYCMQYSLEGQRQVSLSGKSFPILCKGKLLLGPLDFLVIRSCWGMFDHTVNPEIASVLIK